MSRRDAPKSGKLITLEIARFIAAFSVASYHTCGYAAAFGPGWHGFNLPPGSAIAFFFVLSGFVIFSAHASDFGRLERIPRYFWRRICRIYPLYWLSVILPVYLLWPLYSEHYLIQVFTLTPFVHNIIDINPVAWTLRFEVAFYIMFGLILLPYLGSLILAMWIVLDIWRLFPQIFPFMSLHEQSFVPSILQRHFFNNQEILFFCGLGAGAVLLHWRPHCLTLWAIFCFSCLMSVLLARLDHWGFTYPKDTRVPLVGMSYATVIFSLAALERGHYIRLKSGFAFLGAISYPLYLFHVVVLFFWSYAIHFHIQLQHALSSSQVYILALMVSLILSAASIYCYDRPIQKLSTRLADGLAGIFKREAN